MNYNFDEIIDRKGTDALKLEALLPRWGREDLIPMWIADMDFRTPPFIVNAVKKRIQCEVFGYTDKPLAWYQSIINWQKRRHHLNITKEMICFVPGVVPAIVMAMEAFTNVGDNVLIQPPVYYPFEAAIRNTSRKVVTNPLLIENGQYRINFEDFEEKVKICKLFILCNPHNPGGRVWTREELQKLADICSKYQVLMISDEIHADLTLPSHQHTSLASLSKEVAMNCVTFSSASKTFNMAGLASAYAIIPNPEVRQKFLDKTVGYMLTDGNIFAFQTTVAAYEEGEEWLSQLLQYIQGNINFLLQYVDKYLPKVKYLIPQASYLVFLDFRELGLSQEELVSFCTNKAHLALVDGSVFGKEGTGFMRINLASPRSVIEKALNQLKEAFSNN
ncbi:MULTISPECIES: MalY/PatB family protein [unclassified Capnocytophaga]|jgi:Bifunctional PLP-dependent enzyme with beta-cystathionase and maltose regulon repressor activities|uniref:MalY/PatB family protein n=1 Tax=unclassified Capnocytophaga TaxID=2640652 RepID=UPI000202F153|nr:MULTISPECIES: MalY/PatB family protein [unclassified Capnocytophaga]EGD33606.1 hemolysin [Capnocytophaga sp. oral taxon 338 str. F0234]MEB3004439.1 MalY/PatB family protein [Capnocytophaga sp. G2]